MTRRESRPFARITSPEATRRRVPPPSPPTPFGGVPANHSGETNKPYTRVVIHSAVMPCEPGRARQLAEWNAKGSTGGSWHYATDPAATVQCSWDRFVCWHAPPNPRSIGIEMADHPGAIPDAPRGSTLWKRLRASWRWTRKPQRAMLRRTAKLTAHLLAAGQLPPRYVGPRDLRRGGDRAKGWTTHDAVSRAFGESSHWDPGFWPRRHFARLVRRHHRKLTTGRK